MKQVYPVFGRRILKNELGKTLLCVSLLLYVVAVPCFFYSTRYEYPSISEDIVLTNIWTICAFFGTVVLVLSIVADTIKIKKKKKEKGVR